MSKCRLGMRKLWKAQKLIGLNTSVMLPMTEIASAICLKCNWPIIDPTAHGSRSLAKHIIHRYLRMMEVNTNFVPLAHVYFIQSGHKGPIKIGVATDVTARLKELQIGNPVKLKVIASLGYQTRAEAFEIEKKLHKKFAYIRKNGEWFHSKLFHKIKEIADDFGVQDLIKG